MFVVLTISPGEKSPVVLLKSPLAQHVYASISRVSTPPQGGEHKEASLYVPGPRVTFTHSPTSSDYLDRRTG